MFFFSFILRSVTKAITSPKRKKKRRNRNTRGMRKEIQTTRHQKVDTLHTFCCYYAMGRNENGDSYCITHLFSFVCFSVPIR